MSNVASADVVQIIESVINRLGDNNYSYMNKYPVYEYDMKGGCIHDNDKTDFTKSRSAW